uniref:hypothetical protein n=1 Tax=Nonomuraea pusilla TaxID=46177 RepID=UPI000A83CF14|nr:hypothetical protein [Nonomuraea pusilla]
MPSRLGEHRPFAVVADDEIGGAVEAPWGGVSASLLMLMACGSALSPIVWRDGDPAISEIYCGRCELRFGTTRWHRFGEPTSGCELPDEAGNLGG